MSKPITDHQIDHAMYRGWHEGLFYPTPIGSHEDWSKWLIFSVQLRQDVTKLTEDTQVGFEVLP